MRQNLEIGMRKLLVVVVGVNHEKKKFLVLTLICWENVFLKGRHGRLNPQNMKKNGPVVFEKIVFSKNICRRYRYLPDQGMMKW
jgi:hypothetical protein